MSDFDPLARLRMRDWKPPDYPAEDIDDESAISPDPDQGQRSRPRPPEVRRVVELKQSMIVKAGDAVVNPVCCLKAREEGPTC